jgi:hypothetical protein
MISRVKLFLIFFSVICMCGNGVAGEKAAPAGTNADSDTFLTGYELFERKAYSEACPYFYRYLSGHSPDDSDYEWAEFFFGICLKKLDLSHAAADILGHLVTRKPNPKIVSYCLELFEEMTRTMPFDRDLVIHQVICDQQYGFVEDDMGDFVHFYQGVYDWEHGFFEWGNDHFSKIRPGTYYYYKYLYQKALICVYRDQIDEAVRILKEILDSPGRSEDIKDEVRKTLARLLYEKGQYREADLLYQQIRKHILEQSQDLLERAWAHYRMENPERAMGLLYAFEAPSFKNHFSPEYYILKSFIYKDVCHYQKALEVVGDFKARYGNALENIHHRGKLEENNALLLVLLGKRDITETWSFLQLLEKEKERCKQFEDDALYQYLERIYVLQIQESADTLKKQIQKAYEQMANEMLQYEEEAHLMEYEIGLDMYQRVYKYHYKGEGSSDGKDLDGMVVYPFQGEFWNDELEDYHVTLPNKCHNMEEWDIFFK